MPFPLVIDKIDKLKHENFPYKMKKSVVNQGEKTRGDLEKLKRHETRKRIETENFKRSETRRVIDARKLKHNSTFRTIDVRKLNHANTRKNIEVGKLQHNESRRFREFHGIKGGDTDDDDLDELVSVRTKVRWTEKRRSTVAYPTNDGWYGSRMPYKFNLIFPPRKPRSALERRRKVWTGMAKVRTIVALTQKPQYNSDGYRTLSRLKSRPSRIGMIVSNETPPIRRYNKDGSRSLSRLKSRPSQSGVVAASETPPIRGHIKDGSKTLSRLKSRPSRIGMIVSNETPPIRRYGSRSLSRLKFRPSQIEVVAASETPPIGKVDSYFAKHQSCLNRLVVLPDIGTQGETKQAERPSRNVQNIVNKNFKRQKPFYNMVKEGPRHYNRQSKRSRATNQGSNGPHHGRRRPSLENLVLLATFSASLIGSQRRRQARRRSTSNWGRLSTRAKQPETWTRLQSRNLRSLWNKQNTIDKWFKITSGIKVRMFHPICFTFKKTCTCVTLK